MQKIHHDDRIFACKVLGKELVFDLGVLISAPYLSRRTLIFKIRILAIAPALRRSFFD